MFTGIVEETGTIESINWGAKSAQLKVKAAVVLADVKIGDSINTNGCCLTVIKSDNKSFTVDVMEETMRRSNLHQLQPGMNVNLERAMRLSDRLGGHMVSGHIDDTGTIRKIWKDDNAHWITVAASPEILNYIIYKGSVALDGVSLTVANVEETQFSISIIPHTSKETTLLDKKAGDQLNIECDLVAKYLEKFTHYNKTNKKNGKVDMNYLSEHGFID